MDTLNISQDELKQILNEGTKSSQLLKQIIFMNNIRSLLEDIFGKTVKRVDGIVDSVLNAISSLPAEKERTFIYEYYGLNADLPIRLSVEEIAKKLNYGKKRLHIVSDNISSGLRKLSHPTRKLKYFVMSKKEYEETIKDEKELALDKQKNPEKYTPIEVLNLEERYVLALKRVNIDTIEKLLNSGLSPFKNENVKIRGLGKLGIISVREKIDQYLDENPEIFEKYKNLEKERKTSKKIVSNQEIKVIK